MERTIPYFLNSQLGFVQTPQHFSTLDPFQRNLVMQQDLSNEQDLFYHVILPGMDAFGSVTFAGSGTVFRRKALDDVKGFAVETVTEDMHTGLRLHDKGWQSFYVNEDLSSGLAPETFSDFLNQRLRWGRGATQVFVIENPLSKTGLTLPQKLNYFNNLWYFLHGIPRVIFLMSPLAYLLFGIVAIDANFLDVLTYYLSFGIICSMTYMLVSGRVRQVQWAEMYETVFCFYLSLVTLWSFFNPYKAHFKVTPKGETRDKLSFELDAITPQIVLLGLTITGMALGLWKAASHPELAGFIAWNTIWAAYNGMLLLCTVLVAVNRPQRRGGPRVDRSIPVEIRTPLKNVSGRTLNMSEAGLFLLLDEPVPVRGDMQIKLVDWSLGRQTEVSGDVVRSAVNEAGQHYIALQLRERDEATRKAMVLHTFTAPDTWQGFHKIQSTRESLLSLVQTPLRWLQAKELPNRRIDPRFPLETGCVLLSPRGKLIAVGKTLEVGEMGAAVAIPRKYKIPGPGKVTIRLTWPDAETDELAVVELEAMLIREVGGDADCVHYGISFPHVTPIDLTRLQTTLYSQVTLNHAKRVYGARNVKDARFRLWNAQTQEKWSNVKFIQAGVIPVGQYVPFNIKLDRAPALTGNVVPIKPGRIS